MSCTRWFLLAPLAACSSLAETVPARLPATGTPTEAPASPPDGAGFRGGMSSREALEAFDAVWQTVNDCHFDPTFNGVDWVAVRDEFRPRAEAARSRDELRAVIDETLGRLGQSHFVLLPAEALADEEAASPGHDLGTFGFDVRLRDGSALVSTVDPAGPAARGGVRPGWVLERIGDFAVDETPSVESGEPRRVALVLRQSMQARIRGRVGSREEVLFRDGEDREVVLELERSKLDAVAHDFGTTLPTFQLEFQSETIERDGKRIGRIHFTNWFVPMLEPIHSAIDQMRTHAGIVIDLRGNTGGVGGMVMGVAGNFFTEMTELGVTHMREGTLRFVAVPRKTDLSGQLVAPFAGLVAILIDETTASSSEVFAGGMQSVDRARVFGEVSVGAVLPATTTPLPNGDVVLHALGDFKTAQGTSLEGRGVIPDEIVPLTREDLLAGRDPQLEAAVVWIAAHGHP